MNTKQFLDQHSREAELREAFKDFDSYSPEQKEDIRFLWANAHKTFAHNKLVNEYGMSCDCNWCAYAFHSSVEIAGERGNE